MRGVVKAVKKHLTLLAIHLSYIPFLRQDRRLQAYIRKKLGMSQIRSNPQPSFSTNAVLRAELQRDWILRDKLQNECNVVEKVSEYYKH